MPRRMAMVGLVGVLAVTTACSSGSTPAASSAASTTSAAAESSVAESSDAGSPSAQSSPVGGELTGTAVDPAELSDRLIAGYRDLTSGKGTLQAGVAGQQVNATFEGSFQDGTPTGISVSMSLPAQGQEIPLEIVVADGQLYLSSPPLLSQLGVTKKWLLVSADSANPAVAQIGQQIGSTLESLGSPDQTAKLAGSATQVTEVGTEDHNGVEATHYQLLLDPSAMAAAEQGAAQSGAASAAAQATEPILVDMWVDADDRVIGTTTVTEVSGQQVTAVYEITSFNEPVTITAPDPAETATG